MGQPLSGAGVGLQIPQQLYPANLTNGSVTTPTNQFTLAPGEALPIPAGRWVISLGKYASLQYLDPVTTGWTLLRDGDNNDGTQTIWSDGFNVRVANLTGCAVGAVVTNGGAGYTSATTTVSPSTGNSTWQPIIGGAVSTTVSVTSITTALTYGIAPLVFFDAPPTPGIPATGIAVLTTGTLSSITVVNQGAGYTAVPNITIVPNPADPNIASGTPNSAAVCSLTGTGALTGVICTNSGVAVATTMSLTVVGAGASATVTPLFLETVTGISSVNAAGSGYGAFTALTTIGGYNTTASPAFTNPEQQLYNFVPREAYIALALSGTAISSVASVVDGGLYITAPSPLPLTNGIVTTAASLTLSLGGANTQIKMQQVA